MSKKQSVSSDQLSWLDIIEPMPLPTFECSNTESQESFKHRRTMEMAKKLGWPALHIKPVRQWSGLTIPQGEDAWHDLLDHAPREIGLVMLALYVQFKNSIDESTGLYHNPVESFSQIDERCRSKMIQMARYLAWPRISCWMADTTEVFGPGEDEWRKYAIYGGFGLVSDAIGALERKLRGEPDQVRRIFYQEE